MPLSTLRPMQIAQPQPMNALMMGQQARRQTERQNWLRAQEGRVAEQYETERGYVAEDRKTVAETRKFQQVAKALSTALKAQTPQMQTQIYNALKPKDSETPTFTFQGGKMTIKYPDGEEISGPMKALIEFTEQVKNDSTWITDPAKARHTVAWATSAGLNVDLSKTEIAKPKKTYDMVTIYGPKGQTKRKSIERGTDYKPPVGWTLTKPTTGKGAKVLTLDQLNTRIETLQAHKLRAQTTGAMDSSMLIYFMIDSEEAQKAIAGGDASALIREIDKQLEHYEGQRAKLEGGVVKPPEPEPKPESTKLPEGITQEMLDNYKETQGYSADQIIDAYKTGKKLKPGQGLDF